MGELPQQVDHVAYDNAAAVLATSRLIEAIRSPCGVITTI